MPELEPKSRSSYIAALLLTIPVVCIIWVLIIYPVNGTTGEIIHPYYHIVTGTLFYSIIFGWALYGSDSSSEIVYRLCRFGAILSLLMPVSSGLTSLAWVIGAADRPEGFLVSASALEIPVYSAGIALLLIILFLTGSYLAARNMEGVPF